VGICRHTWSFTGKLSILEESTQRIDVHHYLFGAGTPGYIHRLRFEKIYMEELTDYTYSRNWNTRKRISVIPNGDTYWLLSEGTGTVKMDIFSISYVNLFDKSKGTTEQECVTTLRYKMNGAVQKDGIFTPADLDLGGSNSE
jgi:hypothetical protein